MMRIAPASSETTLVYAASWAFLAAGLFSAMLAPAWLWPLLLAGLAGGAVLLAFRYPTAACVIWLLPTASTLEMALLDLIGPGAFPITIAAEKTIQVGLATLCALRHGPRLDPLNPAWVFIVIAAIGLAHGLYPGLSAGESLRSLAGSVAAFAFCFCRVPPGWPEAIIRTVAWCPLFAVAVGAALDVAELRPLFVDSGGLRLAAAGHPAYLAEVTLAALYAGLLTLFRDGRRRDLLLLGVNAVILVLTGARAPLAYAAAVGLLSLILVPSSAFTVRRRILVLLLIGLLIAAVIGLILAGYLDSVRLIHLLDTDAIDLSGRQYLWPVFEAAAAGSPWFGWGVGAGNYVIPPDSPVAQLLRTWAAHNEYLRLQVEGGQVGRTLLILAFLLWVRQHTARLRVSDRRIMRLAFVALAFHALTDNVLISTPACVLFTLAAAVFARGRHEAAAIRSCLPDSAQQA